MAIQRGDGEANLQRGRREVGKFQVLSFRVWGEPLGGESPRTHTNRQLIDDLEDNNTNNQDRQRHSATRKKLYLFYCY